MLAYSRPSLQLGQVGSAPAPAIAAPASGAGGRGGRGGGRRTGGGGLRSGVCTLRGPVRDRGAPCLAGGILRGIYRTIVSRCCMMSKCVSTAQAHTE